LCLSTDAQGYGRRNDRDQSALQDDLLRVLDEAAESAGLCRRNWHRQGSGDGELALVPPGEPEARVLDQYVRAIGALLFGHNQDHRYDERLRLRLAVDHGPVDLAANGFAGRPVVAVSRLVNSAVLRLALATSHADLAVIVSGRTYTDLVLGGHTSVPSADFRMVPIREKEFHEAAWLRVPGVDVHVLDLGIENQPAADPPAGWQPNGQTVVNHITGRVDAPGSVIGIRNG
jgi:hypothetical protein